MPNTRQDTRSASSSRSSARSAPPEPLVARLWHASKALCVAAVVVIALCLGIGVDALVNHGRIYPGVHIGDIDVSGMTVDEAAAAVQDRYGTHLAATTAFIFDSPSTADAADIDQLIHEMDAVAEQISVSEAKATQTMWMANAETLDAVVPTHRLATDALEVGRDGRILDRFAAAFSGQAVPVVVDFDEDKLELLINDIDSALGTVRLDWGVRVEDGQAQVTEGHDGDMIDPDAFVTELTASLLADDAERVKLVAQIEHAPIRIDQQHAQTTCDAVNAAIEQGASFMYDGKALDADRSMLGDWVVTEAVERDGAWQLAPSFDHLAASRSIATSLTEGMSGSDISVHFTVQGDEVIVTPDAAVVLPSTDAAISQLDESLFGAFRDTGTYIQGDVRFGIPIQTETTRGPFTFDEAVANGLITRIAMYTTTYNDTASTQNRTFNIHRAADAMNNSVVSREGGTWSFNDTVGSCDAAAGYKDANAIMDGEVVAEAGGGICQVATTVFNAVYNSGLPILERHNHTLHMSSYPDGRDAAIAYPQMDLRWGNDTQSDILVRTGYSDTSITVSLYGISPGYSVKTQTGDWEEGKKYKTRVEVDEEKPEGYQSVKTVGTDGMEIYVIRTVTDKNEQIIRQDRFDSVYSPVDKVILTGPNTPVELEETTDDETD
ncbi:VanW family protein [Adlercreutzia murintestinalis]|uniref:VanW family protein n=1 Tax=Adlercreutzia murintestinalis TaxID=2941325 RepID=UPI00203EF099|nr:VanW family protein [Adlercreutzia murintestinalis]